MQLCINLRKFWRPRYLIATVNALPKLHHLGSNVFYARLSMQVTISSLKLKSPGTKIPSQSNHLSPEMPVPLLYCEYKIHWNIALSREDVAFYKDARVRWHFPLACIFLLLAVTVYVHTFVDSFLFYGHVCFNLWTSCHSVLCQFVLWACIAVTFVTNVVQ